MLSLYD